jgi:hypothetical protein
MADYPINPVSFCIKLIVSQFIDNEKGDQHRAGDSQRKACHIYNPEEFMFA